MGHKHGNDTVTCLSSLIQLILNGVSTCSEDGRLLKLINTSRGRQQLHPVVVEVLQVFSRPIIHVHIHGGSASRRQNRHGGRDDDQRDNGVEPKEKVLVVASRIDIVLLPLQRCHTQTSCRQVGVLQSLNALHLKCRKVGHMHIICNRLYYLGVIKTCEYHLYDTTD